MPKNKKKEGFIDRHKAVVFKLVAKDSRMLKKGEDLGEHEWQVVSQPNEDYLNKKEVKNVHYLINEFAQEDMQFVKEKEMYNSHVENQGPKGSDLWINNPEFIKMKQQQKQKVTLDDGNDYIEEFDYEEEEMQEIDEEEYSEEEEDEEEEKKVNQVKFDDPELQKEYDQLNDYQKKILLADHNVDQKKIKFNKNAIKMKQIDENGLPVDTYYNY